MVVCASVDRKKKVIVSDKQIRNKRALRCDWTLSKLGGIILILLNVYFLQSSLNWPGIFKTRTHCEFLALRIIAAEAIFSVTLQLQLYLTTNLLDKHNGCCQERA